jgi:hypothetical protein
LVDTRPDDPLWIPTLEILSTDEIRDRRAHLLVQAGLSEGELRRRADDYSLTREQAVILDRIADLDFLLEA